jgi:hypothetical protein
MADIKQILPLAIYNNLTIIAKKNNMNVDSLVAKVIMEFLNQNKSQYQETKLNSPISRDLSKSPISRDPMKLVSRVDGLATNPENVEFLFCFALYDYEGDKMPEWELVTGYENAFNFLKEYIEEYKEYMVEETLEESIVWRGDRGFDEKMTLREFCEEASSDFKKEFDIDFYNDEDDDDTEEEE